MTEVNVLSQHQCNPSEGQLNALYRIFWYLKFDMSCGKNPNMGRLVYEAFQTEVYDRLFPQSDLDQWNYFCSDADELIPPKIPKIKRSFHKDQDLCVCISC